MTDKEKLQRAFLILNDEIKSNSEEISGLNIKVAKLQNKVKYLKKIIRATSMLSPN